MKSRMSFCDGKMLKRHFTRLWPVWLLIAVFIFTQFLIPSLTAGGNEPAENALVESVLYNLPTISVPLAIVIAGCIFSYLHKSRSCVMIHALPSRRFALYRSGVIAGLLVFALPWTASMLLLLTKINVGLIFKLWIFGMWEYLFFYAVAVFAMIFSGKTVAAVCVYLSIFVILPLTEVVTEKTLSLLLNGVELSAFSSVSESIDTVVVESATLITIGGVDNIRFSVWLLVGLAVCSFVLLLISEVLYRKRKMETVGNVVAYPKAMPVVLYLVTFYVALGFGNSLYNAFFDGFQKKEALWFLLVSILLCGLIGYFVMLMLLKKSLHVFKKKSFRNYGIFALLLSIVFGLLYFDCFGVVYYVPQPNKVESVSVSFSSAAYELPMDVVLTDESDISEICSIHERLIDVRGIGYSTLPINFSYRIDGETVRRHYKVSIEDAEQYSKELRAVLDSEKNVDAHFARLLEEGSSISVYSWRIDGKRKTVTDPQELFDAMKQDILEGNMSLVWVSGEKRELAEITFFAEYGNFSHMSIPDTATHTIRYIKSLPIHFDILP